MCDLVLQYRTYRSRLVREAVISLILQLASFAPEPFVESHFSDCLEHIIHTLSMGAARSVAYLALGRLSLVVKQHMKPKLGVVVELLRDGLKLQRGPQPGNHALEAVSMLAHAMGPDLFPFTHTLLDEMSEFGLGPELVDALAQVSRNVPMCTLPIQHRLLAAVSATLDVSRKGGLQASASAANLAAAETKQDPCLY